MTICIAGKNNIASEILEYLIFEKKINKSQLFVCCNKTDTGKNTWQRSLRFTANLHGIKEVQLEDVYNIDDLIFLSLEFDRLIKPSLFKTNKLFNIHFSLLPSYKGMYTAALPILNNEKFVGVTFHRIDSGIDTGEIIAQKKFELLFNETSRDLYIKNIFYGTQLVKDCIDKYLDSGFNCNSIPQSFEQSSYYSAKTIDYSNISIDLHQTALSIHNQIRAFNFREYQLPYVNSHAIRFAEITKNRSIKKPGTVIWKNDDSMMLATIDYDVVLYFDMFDEVLNACNDNDLKSLEKVHGINYYVNEQNEHGWTPLIIATYNAFYELAMFLITQGANIKAKNNNGTNLLMYSKEAFLKTGDSRLFDFYIANGLSPDDCDYTGNNLRYYCKKQNIAKIGKTIILD